jgi:hypothetical protein
VKLEDGRRTQAAYVPPRSAQEPPEPSAGVLAGPDSILNQLRNLADPEVTGVERSIRGDTVSSGRPALPRPTRGGPDPSPSDRTLYQTRVAPFVTDSIDVVAQAAISADRRYVRLSMAPVFNTVTRVQTIPAFSTPVIPGLPPRP